MKQAFTLDAGRPFGDFWLIPTYQFDKHNPLHLEDLSERLAKQNLRLIAYRGSDLILEKMNGKLARSSRDSGNCGARGGAEVGVST